MAKKARTTIRLDKANESVVFPEWPVRDEILYRLFEQTPAAEYEETYDRVLRIGSYALVEDRIGAFLAKTESEIGVELEHLKLLYELRQHSMQTSAKGQIGEEAVASTLLAFATARGWGDSIQPLGDIVGDLPDNKTGDLVVRVGGPDGPAIAIEVKFDKNFKFGDVADSTHENKNLADIAWSQVVEAAKNRDAELAMIVFDKGSLSPSVKENLEDVLWMPGGGLAVMVDVERDDLRNLTTVYSFARSLLLAMTRRDLGTEMLSVVVSRASREVRRCLDARGHIDKILSSAGALIVDLEQSHAELNSILRILESVDADHPLGVTELLTLHEGAEVREAIADSKKEFEGRGNT